MHSTRPTVFFAIPCGDFYSIQAEIIKTVCAVLDVNHIVAEDDIQTKELWNRITGQIVESDLFVADISFRSPNILLELGYAIREKSLKKIGIFTSKVAGAPSDLQGFVRQEYSSFSDFQSKLAEWTCNCIPLLDRSGIQNLKPQFAAFEEDFLDQERFLSRWTIPPGGSYLFSHEGLRISHAHFPFLTTTLALLRDCEVEFKARIDQGRIGWVVKGTKDPNYFYPAFCVMLNLDETGKITPHIWNSNKRDPQVDYKVFDSKSVPVTLKKTHEGWFEIITRVRGDTLEIEHDRQVVFRESFSDEPFREFYEFPKKEGQIGFRCYPTEKATIRFVRVKEL